MIANINVHFFAEAIKQTKNGDDYEMHEITEACFITLHNQPGIVDYDRSTVFDNGVKQICLTVICDDLPYAEELDVIK